VRSNQRRIRVSIGIDDKVDLIADSEQALRS
jgi:O-acetylhomoserine/O-acetylserine sulfhydrylase-like pyridoxal-dependent enzyme